jgi:hypothetical protein
MSISSSYYYALLFSPELSAQGKDEKLSAIFQLRDYIHKNPDIKTGDRTYLSIDYAIEPFLSGRKCLSENFRSKVIHAELTQDQRVDVQRMGFSTRVVGQQAYEFYTDQNRQKGGDYAALQI